jgi:hypothetical protein
MSNNIQQFVNDVTFGIIESDFVISHDEDGYELRGMDFTISAKDSMGRRWEGRTISCSLLGADSRYSLRRAEAEAIAASPDLSDFEFVGHSYGSELWDDEDERCLACDDHEYQV